MKLECQNTEPIWNQIFLEASFLWENWLNPMENHLSTSYKVINSFHVSLTLHDSVLVYFRILSLFWKQILKHDI